MSPRNASLLFSCSSSSLARCLFHLHTVSRKTTTTKKSCARSDEGLFGLLVCRPLECPCHVLSVSWCRLFLLCLLGPRCCFFRSSLLGFRLGLGSRPSGAILVLAFGCHSQFGVRVRGHDDLGGVFFRGSLSSAVRQRRLALEVRRSAVNVRLVVYVCARSSGGVARSWSPWSVRVALALHPFPGERRFESPSPIQ